MKICMLDPLFYPYYGGTEKVVLEVGKRLVRNHGCEVEVLTSMIPQAKGVKQEEIEGIKVYRTPSLYFDNLPAFLPPPFTISPFLNLYILKHGDADIYHIHNRFWYYYGTLATIKLLLRKKLMLTIHNARPKGISPDVDFWGGLYDDTLGRVLFSACDRINCVSRATLEATIPAEMHRKCAVIYNGVDTKRFKPGTGREKIRERLGIGDAPLVLSNGRLITQKGFPYLLDAFAGVKEQIKDAKLLIIGRGPMKEQLLTHARSLGIADSFSITTGIPEDELPAYYDAADVFVLPSLYEPGAVVLYEALSCGKPIVATNVGGNSEIVSSECGFIVPPCDSRALEERILTLLADEKLMGRMGAASRKRAVENFDWDIITEEWMKSYEAAYST